MDEGTNPYWPQRCPVLSFNLSENVGAFSLKDVPNSWDSVLRVPRQSVGRSTQKTDAQPQGAD